ncbi:hypothetical protein ACQEVB_38100 [Pseudonocardia sp. CA-107938]|uniref:hypothetical protein n=1 Tax=Pseudonocardia sp. CA-107938 TaxID=3240021 RepID=UPI003D8B8D89
MADNNNALAGNLPATPHPALRALDFMVGTWKETGPVASGTTTSEWMEGGFFLVRHIDFHTPGGRHIKAVEYVGFDEDTQTLRSHLMDNHGANFTYTYDIDGDTLTYWFGERGSDNFYRGTFDADRTGFSGRWQWPGGGYELDATKVG